MKSLLLLILSLGFLSFCLSIAPFDPGNAYRYEHLLTLSDHLVVQASNDQYSYNLWNNDNSSSSSCLYAGAGDEYIYSVGVGKAQNSSELYFVAIGLNQTSNTQFVRILKGADSCDILDEQELPTDTDRLEHFVMAVDDFGQVAFGLSMGSFFVYDLLNYTIQLTNFSSIWDIQPWYLGSDPKWYPGFIPFAMEVISIDSTLVVGYQCDVINFVCTPCVYLLTLNNVQNPSTMPFLLLLPNTAVYQDYNYYISSNIVGMSISVQNNGPFALIGLSQYDTVLLVKFNLTDIILIETYLSGTLGIGYGQSLVWLWDDTAAIVSYAQPVLPWSQSQIAVVGFDSNNAISSPLFILPNNQQLPGTLSLNSNILLVVNAYKYFAILFGTTETTLVIPISFSGMCSQYPLMDDYSISLMQSTYCKPGTYNNITTLGPCSLCPPGTKNPGNLSTASCSQCDSRSFCPLGSIEDIPLFLVQNISQAVAYPESPDVVIFDDILIKTMFTIGSTPNCILVSPLFWTTIVVGVALLILSAMGISKFIPRIGKHRTAIVRIFRQTDLIGEGELWVGGLVSFGIIVLVTFAYVFSSSYTHLYPIEDIKNAPFACDTTIRNAKFSTSLQLLATPRNEEEAPVFTLLETQSFTLEVSFVQTLFDCSSLIIQQIIGDSIVQLSWLNCSYGALMQATQTVSLALIDHQMTLKFILGGPHYIGGAYLCLKGSSAISTENIHSVQTLNFCQMFFTENQTLAKATKINIQLTKVINRTTGLSTSDGTTYSGIWIPTFTAEAINDALFYIQQGAYLRYSTNVTTFQVTFVETPFFIKNTQDPVREDDLKYLSTFLFCVLDRSSSRNYISQRSFHYCGTRVIWARFPHHETDDSSSVRTRCREDTTKQIQPRGCCRTS